MLLDDRQAAIAGRVLKEVQARLGFLLDVGLALPVAGPRRGTLSGGEAQRIRLATQIGSGLVGVLYVLDEPSIGLHQRDNRRLIETLTRLRDLGNTLIVVEHDEDTDPRRRLGGRHRPGRGRARRAGGAQRHRRRLESHDTSLTGAYLSGRRSIPVPAHPPADRPEAQARDRRGARAQPARRRRRRSRSAASCRSPGCPGRASRRWSTTSSPRCWRTGSTARGRCPAGTPGSPASTTSTSWCGSTSRPIGRTPRVQPRHLHRRVGPHPQALRRHHRGEGARLPAGPVLVQRQGRALRGVLRRRHDQDRDELPARRLRPVRGLPRRPVQPRDARGALQGQDRRRRAGHADRGGRRVLRADRRDRAATCARSSTSGWATSGSGSRRRRCPAARRSASSWPASCRSAATAARSTSSTSRPPACTSKTSASCST